MNLTVILSEAQGVIFQLILFGGLGFLIGWLFREIGIIKIIALIMLLPASIELLISVNTVILATIPFLICAWLGFYGTRRTYQKCSDVYRTFR